MGCNTSQELKAKKPDDVAKVDEKNETGQTTSVLNGDASAGGGSRSSSVDDNSAVKNVNSSPSEIAVKISVSESEKNAKYMQQQRPPAGDVTNGKHHNSVVNDIKDDSCNVRRCEKADFAELSEIDIDEDGENDEENAATKIQAAFRGHKVRATMRKSEDTSAQAATIQKNAITAAVNSKWNAPAVAEIADPTKEELEAEFDPNDKELCDAALKIQATFRGHLSRKLAGQKAEDVDIQEITKKVAEELDIDLTDPELNKAATKIQASFRGHKSRKDLPAN